MIGIDLQEVARIKDAEKLLERIALDGEKAYIKRFQKDFSMRVASLWAVKEAVFKALDLKNGQISYKEIELCHKESGAPYVVLHEKALAQLQELGFDRIEISISHQLTVVGAVAVCAK